MENNKNKKSVKFQGDMLFFCDFIKVFVFTTNHHFNTYKKSFLVGNIKMVWCDVLHATRSKWTGYIFDKHFKEYYLLKLTLHLKL